MKKRIFISFIEEAIMNEKYWDCRGGRIEVFYPKDVYATEEIRFFTRDIRDFETFRNEWDMKYISKEDLAWIKNKVELSFYEN